jgi:exopolyphosphatase / guanosine-5'-triphosphate,3'-diphosphate pyrophosphatase
MSFIQKALYKSRLNNQPTDQSLIAAIDIGSNSFRLEIGRIDHGQIQRIEYIKEAVRQGADLDEEGNLSEESIQRGIRCLARFGERLTGFKASHVRAVATQTLREANNSDRFLSLAKDALGFEVEIISGVEEARLIYQGVSHFLPQSNERRIIVDIGGRSTEFVLGQGFKALQTASLHVGSVAWSLKHFEDNTFTVKAFERAQIAAESVFETLGANFNQDQWDIAYGASGTVGAIGDILEQYDRPAGVITKEGLEWLKQTLLSAKHVDKLNISGLKEERKAVIGGGLSIMLALFEFLGIDTLNVARGALRHGLQYDMLARNHDIIDLRNDSIQRLMHKFNVDQNHANNVAEVSGILFGQTIKQIKCAAEEIEKESQHLIWASLLHEIGAMVSPIDLHKHGSYIIDHIDPPGFAQSELHRLSLLILAHRSKLKKLALDYSDTLFVLQLLCLRLAVILCHARKLPRLDGIQLTLHDQLIELHLPKTWSEQFPQSYYLLEEERYLWQKTDWALVLIAG